MKLYMLSNLAKIFAWITVVGIFVKIISLIKFHPNHSNAHILPSKMLSGDTTYRKAAQVSSSHPMINQPADEMLELKRLLDANVYNNWSLNGNCAPYPRHRDLHIENEHYQYTLGGNVSYYMFAAYYDRRPAMEHTPSVVILAMINSFPGPFEPGFCQVWYEDNKQPDIVKMEHQNIAWYSQWGSEPDLLYPVLFSCPLKGSPRSQRVPQLVSLVFSDRCARATNALRVIYKSPRRRRATRFGVCVKDLQFPEFDMSDRFIEWLELMRLLGGERVTAYDLGGNTLLPNTRRTLQHYMLQDGFVQFRKHTLLDPYRAKDVLLSKRLNEVLMYIDCFYRNMYEFDYIAIIDVDEVIMPLGNLNNWSELVEQLEQNSTHPQDTAPNLNCEARASYCFRNVYFSRELAADERSPSNFYMLQHVHRVAKHSDSVSAIKCLHSTHYVTTVHNHFPLRWRGACGPYDVSVTLGQMQHYREPDDRATLVNPTPLRDDNIWRFKDKLISNVMAKKRQLN